MQDQQPFIDKIIALVRADETRLRALQCVRELNLLDAYIGAGFVRNLVWDHLHDKATPTPLNDVDVVYFDSAETDKQQALVYQQQLNRQMPELNWQVKNQALMHVRNHHAPYKNTLDALSYWIEKETAVAIRKLSDDKFQCIAAYGFDSLFALQLTYNDKRPRHFFEKRIATKNWLQIWPKLNVVDKS
ncbi:nucleotidyltransferase family protein [Thalassotalea maritima]|uniref:nucleotidyltransferase family protein n=1 Tax=Thalassotalea maritima TaxID=3242416 RepID=UPI003527B560